MGIVSTRIDGDLGTWTHTEWRPDEADPLWCVVERIWDFDGRVADSRERVFPNGAIELIVQLDDRYHDVDGNALVLTPATCVTGIQTGPMVIEAPPKRCRVLGVRFQLLGAWAVLDQPLSPLTGVTADLDDVPRSTAGELAARCHDARDASGRLGVTIRWLCERLRRSTNAGRVNPAVRWAAGCIAAARGPVRIDALRKQAGLSASRLAAAFQEQIGVTPKRYARIHRFRRALDLLQRRPAGLSDLALRAGYYDHPHMDAEFRELAGLTPREFLAARRYPSTVSLAEASVDALRVAGTGR
jgi:AraC-like DNA-binding protein